MYIKHAGAICFCLLPVLTIAITALFPSLDTSFDKRHGVQQPTGSLDGTRLTHAYIHTYIHTYMHAAYIHAPTTTHKAYQIFSFSDAERSVNALFSTTLGLSPYEWHMLLGFTAISFGLLFCADLAKLQWPASWHTENRICYEEMFSEPTRRNW